MKRMVAVMAMVLFLTGAAWAQEFEMPGPYVPPEGEMAGYGGVDLWAIHINVYGPAGSSHTYVPGVYSRHDIQEWFGVVSSSAYTDMTVFQDAWLVTYYLTNNQLAVMVMLPR